MLTYQDFLSVDSLPEALLRAVRACRASPGFRLAVSANAYFRGENEEISRKTILRARRTEGRDASGRRRVRAQMQDVVGNRIGNSFLFRFICQENQYLLQNGVTLPEEARAVLGRSFDHALTLLGEKALLHGVAWGLWNGEGLEVLEAASSPLGGFAPLADEADGTLRAGIQFWQLSREKPLMLRFFEPEEVTTWRFPQGGDAELIRREYYPVSFGDRPPIVPLYANGDGLSEFTPAVKAKIDAYDRILSDFADNLDRANDIYWVLNNFSGTTDDIAETLAEITRIKTVAAVSDGSGGSATAEPHTIEVPYAARETALRLLRRALYEDAMALDTEALTGGSLTNVAIRAAMANLDLKADRYEWQLFSFVRELLKHLGIDTDAIRFHRQLIANELETVQAISLMRQDIDRATALKLNPLLQTEEVAALTHGKGGESP